MTESYAAVLRAPGNTRALLGFVVGYLPSGMVYLALLLLAQRQGVPDALIGVPGGAYAVGAGLGGLVTARLVHRLFPLSVLYGTTLVAVGLLPVHDTAALVVDTALAATAGAVVPPLPAVMRTRWTGSTRGMALQSSLAATIAVIGPAVAASLATVLDARAVLVAAGIACAAGTLALHSLVSDDVSMTRKGWRGPWGRVGLPVGGLLLLAASVSVFEVGIVVSLSPHPGQPGRSGLVLAVWALAEVVGGLWLTPRIDGRLGLVLLLGAAAHGLTAAAVDGSVVVLLLLVASAGALFAPGAVALFQAVSDRAGDDVIGGQAIASTGALVGASAGVALGGALSSVDPQLALVLCGVGLAVVAVLGHATSRAPEGGRLAG